MNMALDVLLQIKEHKIPLETQTRTDEIKCQSVDEGNAYQSVERLESSYEGIDMTENNVNQDE